MGSYKLLQIRATDRLIPTTFATLKHEPWRHALNGERERSDISGVRQFGYRNQQNKTVMSINSEIGLFAVAYRGRVEVWGVQTPPPPEIPKALQNRAKLIPIVKTVKNC